MESRSGPGSLLPVRGGGLAWVSAVPPVKGASLRALLRALVPSRVRRWRGQLAALTPRERRVLLRAALDERLGRLPEWRPVLRRARTVSFVCHGNIIRSPFAAVAFERLVRARGLRVDVLSAGVGARAGEPADPRAIESAAGHGLALETHRATLLDAAHVQAADVLVVMDRLNLARVLARFPEARGRVLLLAGCGTASRATLEEVHDPVAGTLDDVRHAHDEVMAGLLRLADALDAERA